MGRLLAINGDLEARVTALESQMVNTRREIFLKKIELKYLLSDSTAIDGDGPAD